MFEMTTQVDASSSDGDTYAANDNSERPSSIAMRNERKSVVSGKSNAADDDVELKVAICDSPWLDQAKTAADPF